jgi:nucleoside-diphosphate-sugar epimerase
MEDDNANFRVFNVGGKRAITVLEFAKMMIKEFGSKVDIVIPNEFRVGDTRHTVSDTSQLEILGWKPEIQVEQNVAEYVEWIQQQTGSKEYLKEADKIMRQQGIVQYANTK